MSEHDGAAPAKPQGAVAQKFFGAWRYIGTWVDGKLRDRGTKPSGLIYYDPSGYMSAQIAPDRRVLLAGKEPTAEEIKAHMADWISYFGRYSIDERAGIVTHHREGSVQPGELTDALRAYEFKDNRLILRAVDMNMEVVWERLT